MTETQVVTDDHLIVRSFEMQGDKGYMVGPVPHLL